MSHRTEQNGVARPRLERFAMQIQKSWLAHVLAPVLLVVFALGGCGSNELIGEEVPNSPPDTQVESTPPNLQAASFSIDFFWSGSDPDGTIEYFEWIITDNGPQNVFDPADTTGVQWSRTSVSDSTFIVSADIPDFADDVENDQISNIRNVRFWQTHSFFIRAVDDLGLADPTPASVSFTATTISPRIEIINPRLAVRTSCSDGPLALSFEWEATDPDNPDGGPADIRFTLIEWGTPDDPCLTDVQYRNLNPIADLPEDRWSEWIPYDAGNDSGTVKRYPILEQPPGTSFLFAVQARDVAGAVTPTFEFGVNVRHVKTTSQKFPLLTVEEVNLGTNTAVSIGNIDRFDIVAGQPLEFEWIADASSYGGIVEEYRYGFNVQDPENEEDDNWAVPWGPAWRNASRPTGFAQGSPNFVVQARDNSGAISRQIYQFQVIQVRARSDQRPLLLIDDSDESSSPRIEARFDAQWRDNLVGVQGFATASDIIDIRDGDTLEFAQANEYRSLIWLVSSDRSSYLSTRLAPLSRDVVRFNWLDIYQKFVGNVMLVGPKAMANSIEPANLIHPIVFNISDRGLAGLGTTENAQGQTVNVGTLRYPYTAWCLEAIDQVKAPNMGNEGNSERRSRLCDSYTYARVTSDYVERYRPSPARVGNLEPLQVRVNAGEVGTSGEELELFGQLSMEAEEFYNRNEANRNVVLTIRNCQVPMYEAIARMDVDNVEVMQPEDRDEAYHLAVRDRLVSTAIDPEGNLIENCPAVTRDRRTTSRITGAPIVIASTQYTDTKQNGSVPFEDYLWGFNPLSFERAEVRAAVEWILLNQWGLNEE